MQQIEASGYTIYFNEQCYEYLGNLLVPGSYSRIFILCDENSATYCLPHFLGNLATDLPIEIIEIEPGEDNKNISTCVQVWEALTELEADRKSLMINIGGGVITDLGGFVALTFKRGMDFINVPTTLLAMVDASVGGKTGVDLGVLKNQVGIISNPKAVLVDIAFMETLPAEQMRSGLAEMLKHGLIADKAYWNEFTGLAGLTTDDLGGLIHRSVEIKNEVVAQDPYEKGLRKILNFGHTLGHAIESHFLEDEDKTALMHGEAIAVGMVLEAHISLQLGLISETEYREIKEVIRALYMPVRFSPQDVEEIIKLTAHDKKNEAGVVKYTLIEKIGLAVINKSAENDLIISAFADYQN